MGSQDNLLRRSFVPGEILTFWADAADSVGVSNFSAFGDLRLVDEKYGFGAGNALVFRVVFSYSIGEKSTSFVGVGAGPNLSCCTFKKISRDGCFPAASSGGVVMAAMWWAYLSMLTFWAMWCIACP